MYLTIDTLPQPQWPGVVGLARCPGTASLVPDPDRAELQRDLAVIREWGAEGVMTLNEGSELKWLGLADLRESVRSHDLKWWHCPIPDFGAPGRAFDEAWRESGIEILEVLTGGGRILIHCLAGLGRTGTVAAWLLMHQGVSAEQALRTVRQARPGSIQSDAQRAFLDEQQTILQVVGTDS